LFFESWVLGSESLDVHAESNELLALCRVLQLFHSQSPRAFVNFNDLNELIVVFELWIKGVNIFGISAHQYSKAVERLLNLVGKN